MHSENYQGKTIHICDACGFGYAEQRMAQSCENHCKKYGACSLEITRNAVKR